MGEPSFDEGELERKEHKRKDEYDPEHEQELARVALQDVHGLILDRTICPGCGCRKSARWKLCKRCHDKYGRSRLEWPAWLRDLSENEEDIRQDERKAGGVVIPIPSTLPEERRDEVLVSVEENVNCDQPSAPASPAGIRKEKYTMGRADFRTDPLMALSSKPSMGYGKTAIPWPYGYHFRPFNDKLGRMLLPYAPYATENENREYRRANGVKPIRTPANFRGAQDLHYKIPDEADTAWYGEALADEATLASNELGWQALQQAALTDRQREVLTLWLSEDGNRTRKLADIGQELGIGAPTVHQHLTAALEKARKTTDRLRAEKAASRWAERQVEERPGPRPRARDTEPGPLPRGCRRPHSWVAVSIRCARCGAVYAYEQLAGTLVEWELDADWLPIVRDCPSCLPEAWQMPEDTE